jgi:hypothetical protein
MVRRAIYGQAKREIKKAATQTASKLTILELIDNEMDRIGRVPNELAKEMSARIKTIRRYINKNANVTSDDKDGRIAKMSLKRLKIKLTELEREHHSSITPAMRTWTSDDNRKPCTESQIESLLKIVPFLQRVFLKNECIYNAVEPSIDCVVVDDATKPRRRRKERIIDAADVQDMDSSVVCDFDREINGVDIQINTSESCACGGETLRENGHVVCKTCGDFQLDKLGVGDAKQLFDNTGYIGNKCVYDITKDFKRTVHGIGGGDVDITPEILEAVKERLDHLKLDPARMTQKTMQTVLRKLEQTEKMNHKNKQPGDMTERLYFVRVYKAIPYLLSYLCGQETLLFTDRQKQHLYMMFNTFQRVYPEICPDGNMINKRYLVYKFCELSGWKHMLPRIKMVKAVTLRKYDDKVWRHVCEKLGWKFHRCCYL